jgi:hypothetical protein
MLDASKGVLETRLQDEPIPQERVPGTNEAGCGHEQVRLNVHLMFRLSTVGRVETQ